MTSNASSTPFSLGAYLGVPDDSSAANQAAFLTDYQSFTSLMGAAPGFLDYYIDQTQPISAWISNAGWAASSAAATPQATDAIPVIGLPMESSAAGSLTPDQFFQAFAAGTYDSTITALVKTWAEAGFTSQDWRPGWEMNLSGTPNYAGDTAQDQADWVAAFQHIYTVLHAAGQEYGVTINVIWNPGTTNYSNAEATTNLYPGNNYVDTIGADVYSDIHPYSDTVSGAPEYHDWATGGEDSTVAQFIANPINREHYWTDPAATEWSNDSSGGHALSLDQIISFAEAQGKPIALPETGAGDSDNGTDVSDDPAFPQWLAQQLLAAEQRGSTIAFVNIWDSNAAGNYGFSESADDKPLEAAAWAGNFGATSIACFCPGSGILTPRGEVAVEDLGVGDEVVTASGCVVPVRWIGLRRMDLAHHPERARVQPVRIRAGAFGAGRPHRDLLLSPEHAVYVDDVLVPIRHLVGCTGVAVDWTFQSTTYYHLELPRHDIVLAEGLLCESWLDTGNRAMFDNSLPVVPACVGVVEPIAPLVVRGPMLDAIREHLGAPPVYAVDVGTAGLHNVALPSHMGTVRLRSPFGRSPGDARLLGLAIRAIALDGVPISLSDARLRGGFHQPEGGWRWTDGCADIDVGHDATGRLLHIDVVSVLSASSEVARVGETA